MPDIKQLIRELAQHAITKKGAQQSSSYRNLDVLECPQVVVPGASWSTFFEMDSESVALMPVLAARLQEHQKSHPTIQLSEWAERDGHVYMNVPLDAGIPIDFLKSLIDEAYAIVWNKLDAGGRLMIALAGQPYDEPKLMDQLIDLHDLQPQRTEIKKIARPAVLLRTRKSPEAKIALGATKIGGKPDLPPQTPWPVYRDGKPLAFLAQINLAEIAKLGTHFINGLPAEGLLSIFSAWGWMEENDGDPQIPHDDADEQSDWTTIVLSATPDLKRRKTPPGVNSFKAAAVETIPILSLPNHRVEPPIAALDWTDDELERFDEMQSDYRSIQMGHWLKNSDTFASHHLLGGYALFQQEFPEELLDNGLAMFLQIGTDDNSEMGWGDGGELTFYADAKALAQGRFERLWGTCQGG